jgi:hypothetical protein
MPALVDDVVTDAGVDFPLAERELVRRRPGLAARARRGTRASRSRPATDVRRDLELHLIPAFADLFECDLVAGRQRIVDWLRAPPGVGTLRRCALYMAALVQKVHELLRNGARRTSCSPYRDLRPLRLRC